MFVGSYDITDLEKLGINPDGNNEPSEVYWKSE